MSLRCPREYIAFAARLADAAGAAIRPHFRAPVAVEAKKDATPVTIADCQAETAMRALIGRHYPDHGIIGEEFAPVAGRTAETWVLDPIDGTKAFITGQADFSAP